MACILKTNTNLKADRSVEIACTCRQIIGLPTSSCLACLSIASSSSSVSSCEASRVMTAPSDFILFLKKQNKTRKGCWEYLVYFFHISHVNYDKYLDVVLPTFGANLPISTKLLLSKSNTPTPFRVILS